MVNLIIKSNIKEEIINLELGTSITSISNDVPATIEFKIREILTDGIYRAVLNKRNTLIGADL